MNLFYLLRSPDAAVWGTYLADFVRDTLAAVAGAGFGAWLGARVAFRFARTQAIADRQEAAGLAASELAERRATAGNLAMFALSQMHNDVLFFRGQLLGPADKTRAPWFWMPPLSVSPSSDHKIDAESLAFLLRQANPERRFCP